MGVIRGSGPAVREAFARTFAGRRGRTAAAVTASVTVHLALFLFAFSTATGDLVSASGSSGAPVGPVFAVTLVRLPSPSSASERSPPELRALVAKLRDAPSDHAQPVLIGDRTSALAALADRLRTPQPRAEPRQARPDAQGSPQPPPPELSHAWMEMDHGTAETDGQTRGTPSTGDLWGRIQPCWRNLGVRPRVPVVLEVALDGRGDLRAPPKVLRSTTAIIDEPRLQSESGALAALAACIPRGDLRFGGQTYRLEFPAAQ